MGVSRLDADRVSGWVHTVVKHEALAVNRARTRLLGPDGVDVDAIEARTAASPEDRVLSLERTAQTAEALKRLKPHDRSSARGPFALSLFRARRALGLGPAATRWGRNLRPGRSVWGRDD